MGQLPRQHNHRQRVSDKGLECPVGDEAEAVEQRAVDDRAESGIAKEVAQLRVGNRIPPLDPKLVEQFGIDVAAFDAELHGPIRAALPIPADQRGGAEGRGHGSGLL